MDLRAKPFYLSDAQIGWVEETLASMSTEEKLGQLFCLLSPNDVRELLDQFDRIGIRPGGILLRGDTARNIREKIRMAQEWSRIPMFIAGDLDRGSSNMITDGTACGHQMEIAATGDPELAYKTGLLCARECAAVGANWNFGPVVDIDMNHFNPITNVRTFGSDPETVKRFGLEIARGMRDGSSSTSTRRSTTVYAASPAWQAWKSFWSVPIRPIPGRKKRRSPRRKTAPIGSC